MFGVVLFGAKSKAICLCLVYYVLRRYMIELNTTNSIHPIKLNLWCFLFVWCNFYRFNLFWCKKIKIFVFCARINLKGVDTGRTCVKISLYPQENMHYFWCWLRCCIGVLLLPWQLWGHQPHTKLYYFSLWTPIRHCVISFALFDARWAR